MIFLLIHSSSLFRRNFLLLFLVFPGVCNAGLANANEDAVQWLQDMRQAVGRLNYEGTLVYAKEKRLDSFQVFHGFMDGVERERMLSTNSPLREVIRNAETVTCYFPDTKTVAVEQKSSKKSIFLVLPDDIGQLARLYDFSLGELAVIAQHESRLITIHPKDDLRYERRIWIAVDSKLPLKFELLDENGQSIEQIVYTDIKILPQMSLNLLQPSTLPDDSWIVKDHKTLPASTLNWSMDGVPNGFRLVSYSRLKRSTGSGGEIDHLLLSDGLASVSIYIDEVKNQAFAGHPRKIGAINSYTRIMDGFLITVMGEVPEKTVQSIANGIHKQNH